jgi:hypothetical protein
MSQARNTAPVGPPIGAGEGSRANLVFALMVAVLLVVGYLLWRAYEQAPPEDAPVVAAPAGAFKVRQPEAPRNAPAAELEAALAQGGAPAAPAPRPPVVGVLPAKASPPAASSVAQPQTAKAPPAALSASGHLVVQIAALRSEDAASASWKRLAAQAPELFQGVKMDVQRADLGAKGAVFRLRAGYFGDRRAADSFCAGLKQKGQDCIVAAR